MSGWYSDGQHFFLIQRLRSRQTSRTRKSPHKKENSAQRAQNRIAALTEDNYQPPNQNCCFSCKWFPSGFVRLSNCSFRIADIGEERDLRFTFACLLSLCHLGLFSAYAIMAKVWRSPTGSRTQPVHSSTRPPQSWSGTVPTHTACSPPPPGAILSTTQVGKRMDSCHGVMEINRSNFDVLVKCVLVEQKRTPTTM